MTILLGHARQAATSPLGECAQRCLWQNGAQPATANTGS